MGRRRARTLVVVLAVALVVGAAGCGSPAADRGADGPTAQATPDAVVESEVTVTGGSRAFSALLVQPRDGTAYPVVVFGHGFLQPPGNYRTIIRALAARGYVVIAPESSTEPLPSHSGFAAELVTSAEWARAHVPRASPGAGASSGGEGIVGHSMGGGAALLAARSHPQFTAVATLAAAETRPSAVAAAGQLGVPVLFVVGSEDDIVRPPVTRAMYAVSVPGSRWLAIAGGSHCGFVDEASWGGFGCDSGTMPREAQLALSAQLVGDWLDVRLKGRPAGAVPSGVSAEER